MLTELTIRNFAIIDSLTLQFTGGFNVLTSETGAGKSIIIDAVSLLLGGRATSDSVRAETKTAFVEGQFTLSPTEQKLILPILAREGLEGDNEDILILGREIRTNGRNFCRINGRTVSLNLLGEVAAPLIDIHGQHHHLSLLQVKMHGAFLDRFGNLNTQRKQVAESFKKLQKTRKELHQLQQDAQHIARRIDQLTFQVEEILAADLQIGEEATLTTERTRLANAERLSQLANESFQMLAEGNDEQVSASDLVGQAIHSLNNLLRIDNSATSISELAESISYQLEDLAGQLQSYVETVEFSPERLQEVEERLGLIFSLKRKYGDSIADILSFEENASAELESISGAETRIESLLAEENSLRHQLGDLAGKLSMARKKAGKKLARGVEAELQSLGMARTQFQVSITHTPAENGVFVNGESLACDETGIDHIEFLIAPNPGEALKPMVKIASGGETSRLMLALKTVLARADETPTLIFDEIDQGIGGRIGGVVGDKLRGLAHHAEHQVLCITHLPQIAAYGDTHYHVVKEIKEKRTRTRVNALEGDARVDELAQMLGTLTDATRLSAQELLAEAIHQA